VFNHCANNVAEYFWPLEHHHVARVGRKIKQNDGETGPDISAAAELTRLCGRFQ